MGDSLKVKAPDARKITLLEFKPREEAENVGKLYFTPKKVDKEMLHGSVIWFKPKEGQGSGKTRINNNVKDIVRLRSGSRNTPQRQNKSLDMDESAVENVKQIDNKNGQTNPRNTQVSQPRTSKSIEQNKKDNEDPVLKDIEKNASKHGETSKTAAKSGRGSSQNRR